jgi:hypothetical protein
MTAPFDTDRRIREFLAPGPAELPDRSFDQVRHQIERTHQRVVFGPRRDLMPGYARLALVAASIVAVTIVSLNLLPVLGGFGSPPADLPTATASADPPRATSATEPPATTWLPFSEVLDPGTYAFDLSDEFEPLRVSVTVPGGWASDQTYDIYKGDARLGPWTITHIYTDGCRSQDSLLKVGPSVDDLAGALADLGPRLPQGPTPTRIGGLDALRVSLTLPVDVDLSDCRDAEGYRNWPDPGPNLAYGHWSSPGQVDDVYIMDLEGERLVIVASYSLDTSAAALAELRAVIDSVEFVDH